MTAVSMHRIHGIVCAACCWLAAIGAGCAPAAGSSDGLPPPASIRTDAPYLEKAAVIDSITVWVVDGAFVRTYIDEEFTNFGQHYGFSFIPVHEFWLDREAEEDERQFYIDHLLKEYRLMERGMSYDSALTAADILELEERHAAGDLKRMTNASGTIDTARVHKQIWGRTSSGLDVWIVDGRLVRSTFFIDFTEGGHALVYPFVPMNEVWIDNDLTGPERPYVLFHELFERALMARGWTYDSAHAQASLHEHDARLRPGRLAGMLKEQGWPAE